MHFTSLFKYCPKCGSENFTTNNVKSKKCLSCGFVMYINPAAATAGFIMNENGELLVCERGREPEKGTLDLPGGFVDDNETSEYAITREIKEELNLDVTEQHYLFSIPNKYTYSGWTLPTLDIFFKCTVKDFSKIKAADDVASFRFIRLENIEPEAFGLSSIKKAVSLFRDNFKKTTI